MSASIPLAVLVEAMACLKLARQSCPVATPNNYARFLDAYCDLDQFVAPLLTRVVQIDLADGHAAANRLHAEAMYQALAAAKLQFQHAQKVVA